MSDRITRADLDKRVDNVNRRLIGRGSNYRWAVQGRNGYIGLDRYLDDGTMVSTITVGTKREIGDFLHAAMVGMDDVELGKDARRNG